ncbi:SMC-Scp complex subunit ScpB [Klenkia taihuensis]|uniref:Segregation and condensation protein B n=1 Tax=Klenkia taihuensis TaxID=1225127 RepID=A0A1I1UEQ8_9ACTN|nr:SMC-Scp complex subunit ScpB [Klenkia taihuensis]GHE06825.1 segregation and condensation protein B [Klenkia taihuensis]SFD67253.1 segregation and condensation protein B [Klenkia taihuensis]
MSDRDPIAWDRLAAEISAAEDEAPTAEHDWDAVAAELARSFDAAPAPAPEQAPADPGEWSEPEAPPERPAVPLEDLPSLDDVPVEESTAPEEDDDEPAADPEALRGGLEALLFVVDTPVDEATLAAALRCTVGRVRDGLRELGEEYDARGAGLVLRRVGEGWRLYTREEHAPVVERYLTDGQRSRLTQAALETLAVIAYRQPVTRARVSAIRGVGVDAVVRTLVSRGLVHECGTDPDSGGGLYATTPLFLERLGLTGLDELPELGPLLPETRAVIAERPDS